MNDGLNFFDLLVLLVLAAFFISRLRNVLGNKIDDDKMSGGDRPVRRQERVVPLREVRDAEAARFSAASDDEPILADIDDPGVTTGLASIKSVEPGFSVSEFISGAKMAFDMIVDAYAKGDKTLLESLLSRELYEDFAAAIDARKESDTVEEHTLVSIQSADIVRAALTGKRAEITVNFVSEQISVERDKSGSIVSGDPSTTTLVNDEWTFTRDLRSSNPNWTLVST